MAANRQSSQPVQGITTTTGSINSRGAAGTRQSPTPIMMQEQGVNSPRYATPIDDAPNLYPRLIALRTYERMIRNDAQVRASLRACKAPVLGGEWFLDPASNSETDKDVAEFVEFNLFNMSIPWNSVLEEILRMFEFGVSIFEKVFKVDSWSPKDTGRHSREMVMLKKLAYRPPVTIAQYLYDENGGPKGVVHVSPIPYTSPSAMLGSSYGAFATAAPVWQSSSYPGFDSGNIQKAVALPIEKLLIFTYDQLGGNLEGQSLLRTAYKHWYYKEQFYKIDGIQKERHGIGVPQICLVPGYNQADVDFAAQLGRNLRTSEQAYIIQPPGWEVKFAELSGNPVDALNSAVHHDMMIARNVLAQFINLTQGASGTTSSGGGAGSRGGASGVMYDLFLKSLRHVANIISAIFNNYLIPQLVDYNYDVKRYPQLKVRRIGENRDLQMFATALRNLVLANIISVDPDTERWVRNELDMPADFDETKSRLNQSLLVNPEWYDDPNNDEAAAMQATQLDLQKKAAQTAAKAAARPAPQPGANGAGNGASKPAARTPARTKASSSGNGSNGNGSN